MNEILTKLQGELTSLTVAEHYCKMFYLLRVARPVDRSLRQVGCNPTSRKAGCTNAVATILLLCGNRVHNLFIYCAYIFGGSWLLSASFIVDGKSQAWSSCSSCMLPQCSSLLRKWRLWQQQDNNEGGKFGVQAKTTVVQVAQLQKKLCCPAMAGHSYHILFLSCPDLGRTSHPLPQAVSRGCLAHFLVDRIWCSLMKSNCQLY